MTTTTEISPEDFIRLLSSYLRRAEIPRLFNSALRQDSVDGLLRFSIDPRHLSFLCQRFAENGASIPSNAECTVDFCRQQCKRAQCPDLELTFYFLRLVESLKVVPLGRKMITDFTPDFLDMAILEGGALVELTLESVSPDTLMGLDCLQSQLRSLHCRNAGLTSLDQLLIAPLLNSSTRRKGKQRALSRLYVEQQFASASTVANVQWDHLDDDTILKNGWPNLSVVSVSHNKISNLKSRTLEFLGSLKELNLSHNALHHIPSSLSKLALLGKLVVSYNSISSVRDICSALSHVTNLDLSHNQLSTLVGLERLLTLRYLDIRYNQVRNLVELVNLCSTLPNLLHLRISENPVATQKNVRAKLFTAFGSRNAIATVDNRGPGLMERIGLRLDRRSKSRVNSTASSIRSTPELPRKIIGPINNDENSAGIDSPILYSSKATRPPRAREVVIEDTFSESSSVNSPLPTEGNQRIRRMYGVASHTPAPVKSSSSISSPMSIRSQSRGAAPGENLKQRIDSFQNEAGSEWLKIYNESQATKHIIPHDLRSQGQEQYSDMESTTEDPSATFSTAENSKEFLAPSHDKIDYETADDESEAPKALFAEPPVVSLSSPIQESAAIGESAVTVSETSVYIPDVQLGPFDVEYRNLRGDQWSMIVKCSVVVTLSALVKLKSGETLAEFGKIRRIERVAEMPKSLRLHLTDRHNIFADIMEVCFLAAANLNRFVEMYENFHIAATAKPLISPPSQDIAPDQLSQTQSLVKALTAISIASASTTAEIVSSHSIGTNDFRNSDISSADSIPTNVLLYLKLEILSSVENVMCWIPTMLFEHIAAVKKSKMSFSRSTPLDPLAMMRPIFWLITDRSTYIFIHSKSANIATTFTPPEISDPALDLVLWCKFNVMSIMKVSVDYMRQSLSLKLDSADSSFITSNRRGVSPRFLRKRNQQVPVVYTFLCHDQFLTGEIVNSLTTLLHENERMIIDGEKVILQDPTPSLAKIFDVLSIQPEEGISVSALAIRDLQLYTQGFYFFDALYVPATLVMHKATLWMFIDYVSAGSEEVFKLGQISKLKSVDKIAVIKNGRPVSFGARFVFNDPEAPVTDVFFPTARNLSTIFEKLSHLEMDSKIIEIKLNR